MGKLGSKEPKGICLNHESIIKSANLISKLIGSNEKSKYLSNEPLSQLTEQLFSVHIPSISGSVVYFGTSNDKTKENERNEERKQVEPTIVSLPSKQWRKIYEQLNKSTPIDQSKQNSDEDKSKLREKVGLNKCEFAICPNGTLNKENDEYFDELERPVFSCLSLEQTGGILTSNKPNSKKQGTHGKPIDQNEIEIKIKPIIKDNDNNDNKNDNDNDEGEIIVKSPTLMIGLNDKIQQNDDKKDDDEIDDDGFMKTGHVGTIDDDGFLKSLGPIDDQIKLENGTIINPFDIEEALREHPLIDDAAVFGNGKNKLVALLTPDEEQISNESEKLNKTPEQFLKSPELRKVIGKHVDKINDEIDDDNKKLDKFLILDKPFSIDEGELTPENLKNKDVIEEKHSNELDKLFGAIENPSFDSIIGKLNDQADKNENKNAYFVKVDEQQNGDEQENGDEQQKGWKGVTWGEYLQNIKSTSKSLLSLDVQPKQRVLIISQRNSPETTTIYLACQFIGSVPIVLNGKTRKEDISTIIDQTKSSIIFVSLNDSDKVIESTKDNKSVQKIIIFDQNETVQNENQMKLMNQNSINALSRSNQMMYQPFYSQNLD